MAESPNEMEIFCMLVHNFPHSFGGLLYFKVIYGTFVVQGLATNHKFVMTLVQGRGLKTEQIR